MRTSQILMLWVSRVALSAILSVSLGISLAYYLELPWPCGLEPIGAWAVSGCGIDILNRDGFLFLNLPLSLYLGLAALIVLFVDFRCLTVRSSVGARRSALGARRLGAFRFVGWILLLLTFFFVYIFYWKMGRPCLWCKALALLAGIAVVARSAAIRQTDEQTVEKGRGTLLLAIPITVGGICAAAGIYWIWKHVPDVADRHLVNEISKAELEEGVPYFVGKDGAKSEFVIFVDPTCEPSKKIVAQSLALAAQSADVKFTIRPYSASEDLKVMRAISKVEESKSSAEYVNGLLRLFDIHGVVAPEGFMNVTKGGAEEVAIVTVQRTQELSKSLRMTGTPIVFAISKDHAKILKRQKLDYYL